MLLKHTKKWSILRIYLIKIVAIFICYNTVIETIVKNDLRHLFAGIVAAETTNINAFALMLEDKYSKRILHKQRLKYIIKSSQYKEDKNAYMFSF